ncbi:MAG: cysteine methyltransferase [Spirochaeta sp. LUC14_002_19_P3]|nr:MAG: cysteine methyltransferase [Spirochaeta sp. LUC14_002_19_P3]
MGNITIQYHKTRVGELILGSHQERLCLLDFRYRKMRGTIDKRLRTGLKAEFIEQGDDVLKAARGQVDEYLAGTRQQFDLPLLMVGSDFQKSVWEALMRVPYGATSSYLELARNIGNENAVRAVAAANGANAIALIIPCHRIIGSDGTLVGYGGGLAAKKFLLKLEKTS